MRVLATCVIAGMLCGSIFADNQVAALIFKDDFERSDPQEEKEDIGNGWKTNSKARAKGNKQADLRDGAMYITTHPEADHAASITHTAEFKNGRVKMRFMLENEQDTLGLNFADPQCKEVHAGHLFAAKIGTKNVQLQDLKTGNMRLDIYEDRKAKKELGEEQKEALQGKNQTTRHKLQTGKWYEVEAVVDGTKLTLSIDGMKIAEMISAGVEHPTKRMLRLAVQHSAVVDDVEVWRAE